jgi:pimeloyl-ACP methyl ester carboxylesterase
MIEAVVQIGAIETAYRRAGAGDAVLLLTGTTEAREPDWLFDQLARHFRIVAPMVPAGLDGRADRDPTGGGLELEGWLRGLIDGLGLERPAVVAGAACGAGLLRFMVLDPDRVGRMALISPVAPGEKAPAHVVLEDPVPGDPHPVLVMGLPGLENPVGRMEALDQLVGFLAAPWGGSSAAFIGR